MIEIKKQYNSSPLSAIFCGLGESKSTLLLVQQKEAAMHDLFSRNVCIYRRMNESCRINAVRVRHHHFQSWKGLLIQ